MQFCCGALGQIDFFLFSYACGRGWLQFVLSILNINHYIKIHFEIR